MPKITVRMNNINYDIKEETIISIYNRVLEGGEDYREVMKRTLNIHFTKETEHYLEDIWAKICDIAEGFEDEDVILDFGQISEAKKKREGGSEKDNEEENKREKETSEKKLNQREEKKERIDKTAQIMIDYIKSGKRAFWIKYTNNAYISKTIGNLAKVVSKKVGTWTSNKGIIFSKSEENENTKKLDAAINFIGTGGTKEGEIFVLPEIEKYITSAGVIELLKELPSKVADNDIIVIASTQEIPPVLKGHYVFLEQRFDDISEDPILKEVIVNMNKEAEEGELQDVLFREKELEKFENILLQEIAKNPLIYGKPGVGKTQLVEGFVYRVVKTPEKVNKYLRTKVFYKLKTAELNMLKDKQLGEVIKRIKKLFKEDDDKVLFMDEFHNIPKIMREALKEPLARGELSLVAATTEKEKKVLYEDEAFKSRFADLYLDPLGIEETTNLLERIFLPKFVKEHGVEFERKNIKYLKPMVKMLYAYKSDEFFPRSAIKCLDLSFANAKQRNSSVVELKDIEDALRESTKLPYISISGYDKKKLNQVKRIVVKKVIGHNNNIEKILDAIISKIIGIAYKNKPLVIFLAGPTGVGKTYLTKVIAKEIFGTEVHYKLYSMEMIKDESKMNIFFGAPPGYVGYGKTETLDSFAREHPMGIIVLDEIEKLGKNNGGKKGVQLYEMFLNVFNEGVIMTQQGESIKAPNLIFFMTSNIFQNLSEDISEEELRELLRKTFPKEFVGRIDLVLYLSNLKKEDVLKIIDLRIDEVNEDSPYKIKITDKVKELFYRVWEDNKKEGARAINTLIEKYLKAKVIKNMILNNEISDGDIVEIYLKRDLPDDLKNYNIFLSENLSGKVIKGGKSEGTST